MALVREHVRRDPQDWLGCVATPRTSAPLIGALRGDGVGPEVIAAAELVLERLQEFGADPIALEHGGPIGYEAERAGDPALPEDVARFCESVLERGGAILNGPGGGRYVYDLRRRLDLYLKISPIDARNGLAQASPLKPDRIAGLDLLVVRENVGGIYQGDWGEDLGPSGRVARHTFSYDEHDVARFLDAAAKLAARRRGMLAVVLKDAGVPTVSRLWRACGEAAAAEHGVTCSFVDVDLMAYRLIAAPYDFDVVAAPNLCGDVLSDLAGVLVGSRALTFSGNFSPRGDAVYQTNHGAAHDIAGMDRVNPIGQLLSLAMLLRVSLEREREAEAIETAIRRVWREGYRTRDVAARGSRLVGTAELADRLATAAASRFAAMRTA